MTPKQHLLVFFLSFSLDGGFVDVFLRAERAGKQSRGMPMRRKEKREEERGKT